MSNDHALVLSTVTAIIHAPIEKSISRIGSLTFQTRSISGARPHTSLPERPQLTMAVLCRSTSKPSEMRLSSSIMSPRSGSRTFARWSLSRTSSRQAAAQRFGSNGNSASKPSTVRTVNTAIASALPQPMSSWPFLEKNGITFEQAKAANQSLADSHNREETPNFAKSIERRASLR
jgi:hypothetical protein